MRVKFQIMRISVGNNYIFKSQLTCVCVCVFVNIVFKNWNENIKREDKSKGRKNKIDFKYLSSKIQ